MVIKTIRKLSIAEEIGLIPGDRLIKINGHRINDIIDYRYQIADDFLEIDLERDCELFTIELEKDPDEELGLEFETIKYRNCGNKCIFCFIDQNPKNLRTNLYFKDEDFRLSFLHGNFVTLTNTTQKDLDRIVEQRLSPLYVSVHATDPYIRSFMLGLKKDDALLDKLSYLISNHIDIHAQIVLCPCINDKSNLIATVKRLYQFRPGLRSVAIVPVGLTKHRQHLYPIAPLDTTLALRTIQEIDALAEEYKSTADTYFVYLADEFYIKAAMPLPNSSRYEEFPQYENGVGMMRYFIDDFEEQAVNFPTKVKQTTTINLITAPLARTYIEQVVVSHLNKIDNLSVNLTEVKNKFYGENVTVTGLMTGQDIYDTCKTLRNIDAHILPGNCLNSDGLTIDDWTIDDITRKLATRIEVIDTDFTELLGRLSQS